MEDDLRYVEHTPVSRPGPWAQTLRRLPRTAEALVPLVQAVLVHHSRVPDFAAGSGLRDDGTELRTLRALLDAVATLDPARWTRTQPLERRLVVDCRSFALLLCGVLREHGVPARLRFGFASYLAADHWQSHVVCEHHDADGRWTRTDPDTGRFALSSDAFVDATEAWRSAAPDEDLPRYGYAPDLLGRWWPCCLLAAAAPRWREERALALRECEDGVVEEAWLGPYVS